MIIERDESEINSIMWRDFYSFVKELQPITMYVKHYAYCKTINDDIDLS